MPKSVNTEQSNIQKHPFGFLEVVNKPAPEQLKAYYEKKYYQEATGQYNHSYTREELLFFNAKLTQRWNLIQSHLGKTSGRLLDVGCGEGFTLAFFKSLGWRVKGLDFSSHGIINHNPDCAEDLVTGDVFELLENEIQSKQTYHIIWLQGILEHILDPIYLLQRLKKVIAPGGIAVIAVPNDFSKLQQHLLERGHVDSAFWIALPDHLAYFDYQSLTRIVESTGWRCLEILADFPIDWFLVHPLANYIRNKDTGKLAHQARIEIENLINTCPPEMVNSFYAALAKIGFGRGLTAFITVSDPKN